MMLRARPDPTITTFEQAVEFVLKHKVCTIFASKNADIPSLWDNVDLPTEKPEGGGWNERVMAVWKWKNQIPNTFPDEVFYGKLPNGDAMLMEVSYLREVHYPKAHRSLSDLDPLAQAIYAEIRAEPRFTGDLRRIVMEETGCSKSRFDTALKKLQGTLNIVRSNDPALDNDLWLPFSELYW